MKIIVNGEELTLFEGAKVADALRMYGSEAWNDVNAKRAVVLDRFGNQINTDGALSNNMRLFVRKIG